MCEVLSLIKADLPAIFVHVHLITYQHYKLLLFFKLLFALRIQLLSGVFERLSIRDVVHHKDTSHFAYALIQFVFDKVQIQLHVISDVSHLDLH